MTGTGRPRAKGEHEITAGQDGGPSWDRVFADLRELTLRDYGEFDYAALTVHVGDGLPDVVIPVTSASASPSATGEGRRRGTR